MHTAGGCHRDDLLPRHQPEFDPGLAQDIGHKSSRSCQRTCGVCAACLADTRRNNSWWWDAPRSSLFCLSECQSLRIRRAANGLCGARQGQYSGTPGTSQLRNRQRSDVRHHLPRSFATVCNWWAKRIRREPNRHFQVSVPASQSTGFKAAFWDAPGET
jgi:hypothetical protein